MALALELVGRAILELLFDVLFEGFVTYFIDRWKSR
jgi:hypothetical protein